MSEPLSPSIVPRGMSLKQAAAYWGVSPNTYRKFIRDGVVPPPIRLGSKGNQLATAFTNLDVERWQRRSGLRPYQGLGSHHASEE